jgi:hypothetical protein
VVVVQHVDLAALEAGSQFRGGALLAAGVVGDLTPRLEILYAYVRMVGLDSSGASGATEDPAHAALLTAYLDVMTL